MMPSPVCLTSRPPWASSPRRTRLQTQSGPPEDGRGESDSRGEVGGELVVTGGDASPILQTAEHALDEVAPAIGNFVERMTAFAGRVVRNDRDRSPLDEEAPQPVAVIGGVSGER